MDKFYKSALDKERPGSLREQAAAHCGFVVATFNKWVSKGLLPEADPTTGRWNRDELDKALEQLCKFGFEPAIEAAKKGAYYKLPNVHRNPRTYNEVTRVHFYRRDMDGALSGKPGSPEFMRGLIEKEREYARQQKAAEQIPSADSPPVLPEATPALNISAEPTQLPSKVVRAPHLQASRRRPLTLPPRESLNQDMPLRLAVAALLAFPDGSMTESGLRKE
jgi:hypothetical protein